MTITVNNSENGTKVQNPIIVKSCPQSARKLSFKAEPDRFERQSYPPAPLYNRQEEMIKQAQAEQKKQKRKNNIVTGLGIAVSAVMLLYFGRALIGEFLAKQAAKNGGPTAAQRELGIKTREELMELFQDCSNAKSFDDIKMSKELREALENIIDKIENAKTYDEYLQEINNAVLFYGPPGTGKTTFVKALCKKLGVKPFIYDMGALKGGYQGTTENNMEAASKLFLEEHRKMRAKDPKHVSIIFFDECDEIFQKAEGPNKNSDSTILTRFKRSFDTWRAEKGVFVMGNTNKLPEELDGAIANRMKAEFIPCPPAESLSDNFFNHYKKGTPERIADNLRKPTKKSEKFFKIIQANDCRDFSYRDLEKIGWKDGNIKDKTKALTLDDIIQRALNAQKELNLSRTEIQELENLLNMTDDLVRKA